MASTSFKHLLPRLGLIAAALFCALPATFGAGDDKPAAATNPAGSLAFTVAAPAGKYSAQQLSDIVKSAATHRGWTVKESSADRVVIYLNHRHNEATVTFEITDGTINAYTVPNKQTDRWLRYLHKDVEVALGLPAR